MLTLAETLFVPTQHFPLIPSLDSLVVLNLDFAVVFTISLFLVSTSIRWPRRVRLFGFTILCVSAIHVVTIILQLKVTSSVDLSRRFNLSVLVPWEFFVVERLKYLFYDLGVQAGPFLLASLTVIWNCWEPSLRAGTRPGHRTRWLLTCAAVSIVGVAALSAWFWVRESHPIHRSAHVTLGTLYQRHGNLAGAATQFEIALENGVRGSEALLQLRRRCGALRATCRCVYFVERGSTSVRERLLARRIREGSRRPAARRATRKPRIDSGLRRCDEPIGGVR